MVMSNFSTFRGRILLLVSLAALYIPAIYVLSGQYLYKFSTSENTYDRLLLGSDHSHGTTGQYGAGGGYGPQNSTLGFEKIFYISMPERTDRQNAMNLIADFMGLEFTMVPGVNGSTIAEKALPYDHQKKPPKAPSDAELGCWRAHANIWTDILKSGISSALILEDDIDFSTGIRHILGNISTHLNVYTNPNGKKENPYGLVDDGSWDVLSLGHCWNERPPQRTYPASSRIYQAWEDPYSPAKGDYKDLLPHAKSNRIRVLQPTFVVVCTQAYAVSRSGARRLLYHIGGPGGTLYEPLDIVMMNNFRDGKLKGYTAVPSIFGQWKNGNQGDTDIQKLDPKKEVEKGSGGDVINSVRREMNNMWNGRNIWKEIEAKAQEKTRRAKRNGHGRR